jgi:hypothetical protein
MCYNNLQNVPVQYLETKAELISIYFKEFILILTFTLKHCYTIFGIITTFCG